MKNILLIENDDAILRQISNVLGSGEYFLDVAENNVKGYQLALKNLPSLIICNRQIFEKDGNELFPRMKEDNFLASIPFIYIVDDSIKIKRNAQTSGFDFFIKKPFKDIELLKLIKISLDKFDAVTKKTEARLNELRGSISFSLPHEFFTPLNGIIGFSDILIKDFDVLTRAEIEQMLRFINKDAFRLKKMTENFLAFAQLEMIANDSEKVESLRKSYFINPNEMINAIGKSFAKEYGREDDLILELDNAVIRMSEGYVRKMVAEIIDNSFKFSIKGTPVIITTLSNDESVMISFGDSGRGMSPEQISSIGAYMQFNRKMHEQQGSGLGLIIAKKITELHGGEFKIESAVNDGTKINIIFDN